MSNSSSQNTSRDAGARDDAGDRRALPLAGLPARPERARDHRDPGDRQPDLGPAITTPLDNFVPPNDFERILLGRFQGNPRGVDQVQNIGQRRLAGLRLRLQLGATRCELPAPFRAGALALGSVLALAACEEQPGGLFENAELPPPAAARAAVDLLPARQRRSCGPARRTHPQLPLGPAHHPADRHPAARGRTGSPLLDARRRGTHPRQHPEDAGARPAHRRRHRRWSRPAHRRGAGRSGAVRPPGGRVPGNPAADYELTTPLPNDGCSNASTSPTWPTCPRPHRSARLQRLGRRRRRRGGAALPGRQGQGDPARSNW